MIRKTFSQPQGLIAAVALAGLLWLPTLRASVLDPQIYVQQSGSSAAGGSETFKNWSLADVSYGLAAPSSFSLYAFALDTSLDSSTPITVVESGASFGPFILV